MKIGILTASVGNFGSKQFYNAQDIGLGKALSQYVDVVEIYKLIPIGQQSRHERLDGFGNVTVHMLPSKKIGVNGFPDLKAFDTSIDVLIFFSDTQLCVGKVCRWAKRNNIAVFPYVGVLESHSSNPIAKKIMDLLSMNNMRIYRKYRCFAKTTYIGRKLHNHGVSNVTVAPVGLDLNALNAGHEYNDIVDPAKYGFSSADNVVLFIGRMIEEKQPLQMIDLFRKLHKARSSYKLLMVGTGPLQEEVRNRIRAYDLTYSVAMIDRIPNADMWELYRIAKCFVNLNRREIFGMAILEAMYYGCKVVAWHAPGPDMIIENGISGYLVSNEADMISAILSSDNDSLLKAAYSRVLDRFTWNKTADMMMRYIVQ
ncbi:glycosyltransferase family 4 protein [Bifidobacterium simiiventris]|uniref:glycosyltransferase family 4 protein n=1 Tax=Bifidobacterium simiiventris TaxID=2834434 RepID=UPI001C590E8E|nr:glycosyltransferase family 4 protein [Bifidobacterium simiiventris]MBW3078682.1 glycosyltransferase family 4 protein [Bifidobacterium simiiventris]